MAYNYDALYQQTPDALGPPTQVFVDFFKALERPPLRVLDLGCGQGRDALFIARAGHSVVGVDLSPAGIRDMTRAARAEGLEVTGIVADITTFSPEGLFDIVLIDRTLHMLPGPARLACLRACLGAVAAGGACLIADEASNIPAFLDVAEAHRATWEVILKTPGYLFLRRG